MVTLQDIQEVLSLVKLRSFVRSGNLVLHCPFAAVSGHRKAVDSHPSLGILVDSRGVVWNCFTCGRKGDIHSFFFGLETEMGIPVDEALEKLDRVLRLDPEEIVNSIPTYDDLFFDPKLNYPVFPESWLAPYVGKVPKYLVDRGIRIETAKKWQLGFDAKQHRAFFPVRDVKNNLVGALGRLTQPIQYQPKTKNYWHKFHSSCGWPLDHRNGKYLCPNCSIREVQDEQVSEGFRKSLFCYGEHLFQKGQTAVIFEGAIDGLRAYQAFQGTEFFPLSLLGSKVTQEQAHKIIKLTGRRVISFLDNDDAGREGMPVLMNLIGRRAQFFKVTYPKVSDLQGSKEFERLVKTAGKPFETVTENDLDPGLLPESVILSMVKEAKVVFG